MHFLLLKNAHVAVAVYHGCLLVLLACSTWLKGLYINSCFLFLVGLFVCFSCFFWPICVFLILHCLLLQVFWWRHIPVSHGFLLFWPAVCLWPGFGIVVACSVACSAACFSFAVFFCYFYVGFLSLRFLATLQAPADLLVFPFFLLFLARLSAGLFINACDPTAIPFAPPKPPWMICGGHVPTSSSLSTNFPPHTLAKIIPCGPICASVCLVSRLLDANASPCTHPNPYPPSWVPPYPFKPARTYMSFLGKFPGHTWPGIIPF